MTRDEYKQMRMTEVSGHLQEYDAKRKNMSLPQNQRDQAEYQYQSMTKQQDDWKRAGFWTDNEETAYRLNYQNYQGTSTDPSVGVDRKYT